MTDLGDTYYTNDYDSDVTSTPANFGEVHELLEKLKERNDEPQNLSIMEPEFRKPKLKLNNPANELRKTDHFKTHAFGEAKRLQQKQNNSTKKRPK